MVELSFGYVVGNGTTKKVMRWTGKNKDGLR